MGNDGKLCSANQRYLFCSPDSVITFLEGGLDDLEQILVRNVGKQVLNGLFGFRVDGNLVLFFFDGTLAILVDLLKECIILGLVDDLASTGKTNAIMRTDLGNDIGGKMKANTMYFP